MCFVLFGAYCYWLISPYTGTPPLTRFFGPGKNSVNGKPRYRRSILVLKPKNGEFEFPKSAFWAKLYYIFINSVNFQAKETVFQEVILKSKYIQKSAIPIYWTSDEKEMIKKFDKKKIWPKKNFQKKKKIFDKIFLKNRVRWNFNTVFGLKKPR